MKHQTDEKSNYIQTIEARYAKMTDNEFLVAFEEDHEDEISREEYTQVSKKLLPFFASNLNKKAFEDVLEDCESQTADLQPILDRYPDLIAKLPLRELWRMDAWERMKLLISHPVEAVVLLPTLFGDDVWATYLPM